MNRVTVAVQDCTFFACLLASISGIEYFGDHLREHAVKHVFLGVLHKRSFNMTRFWSVCGMVLAHEAVHMLFFVIS